MTPFLKQVASHYFEGGDIASKCFVFTSRRSIVFFKRYLAALVRETGKPLKAPAMITVSELFSKLAGREVSDRITLLMKLFDCYRKFNPAAAADEFIFWGDVILSDFNDIDKYLVPADHIFANIGDFRSMNDYSFLNERQKAAMEAFLRHFEKGVNKKPVKEKFRLIWDVLGPLYTDFNASLDSCGLSYEGGIYRSVAERLDSEAAADIAGAVFPSVDKFVFAGLNALNECEKKLLSKLRDAGLAEFCWDFSGEWIKNPKSRSSFFLSANVQAFPQAFRIDEEGLGKPEINVISVPSSSGEAKCVGKILSLPETNSDNTAVVLPDSGLLMPVLNSLPEKITAVNVTMGYPMASSEMWALVCDIMQMQLNVRVNRGETYFYHKQVYSIFSNTVFKACLSEDSLPIVEKIKADAAYYIPESAFKGSPLTESIFRVVGIAELASYLSDAVLCVADSIRKNHDMSLELDFAKRCYEGINRLSEYGLEVNMKSWFSLLDSLLSSETVPFIGEPLHGLQIMGPLEVRSLDFDNLIIPDCNEGVFPRRSVGESFIPAELRKGFDLPTYEYQDAVWAYYFYRMIQRAGKVWLLVDTRTEVSKSGEESRFIKQLEMHFKADVHRYVFDASIKAAEPEEPIAKTEEHIRKIKESHLSASSLQSYLSCPAKFYYSKVEGLKADEEISDTLDASMIGKVFHETMQRLYEKREFIDRAYLQSLLGDGSPIDSIIDERIMFYLKTFEVTGRNIIYARLVRRYVRKVIEQDLGLMKANGTDRFRLLGIELPKKLEIDGFKFIGFLDRLDSFKPGTVRVVDYKTGMVHDSDFDINPGNAFQIVSNIFGLSEKNRPKIALQLYLYDLMAKSEAKGARIVNSIYQTKRLFIEDVPEIPLCREFNDLMKARLSELLADIANPEVPFRRTDDVSVCKYCDFKNICGR